VQAARAGSRRSGLQAGGDEAALLSTCNRTEIYAASGVPPTRSTPRPSSWPITTSLNYADLRPHLYMLPQARRRAPRVPRRLRPRFDGAGRAADPRPDEGRGAPADQAGGLGTYLHQLFQRSFAVAKEVRSTTEIGAHSVSMAAAAVRLSQRIFDSISDQNVLFIGAGEMIELCATHFAAHNPKSITIANRTVERGEALARASTAARSAWPTCPNSCRNSTS
jgi:glutamyl-tRNA reductase